MEFVIDDVKSTCKVGGDNCARAILRSRNHVYTAGSDAYADNLMLTGNPANSGQPIGLFGTGK